MKPIHWRTIISLFISTGAIIFLFLGHEFIAGALAVTAYYTQLQDVPIYTSWFSFIGSMFTAFLAGFCFDFGKDHFPFLTISVFLFSFSVILRLALFKRLIHSRLLFIEPVLMLAGLSLYLAGNILYPQGWQQWLIPILPFPFSLMLVSGFFKEGRVYKNLPFENYGAKVGTLAPDFSLSDQNGNKTSLSDYKGKQSVLVIFVRGDWCPACHIMLRTYEKHKEKFRSKNVMLLAIGPDNEGVNKQMAINLGVEFKILADDKQETAKKYRTYTEKDPVKNPLRGKYSDDGIPLPASFLVSPDGILRYCSRADNAGEFLDPAMIFTVLEGIGN